MRATSVRPRSCPVGGRPRAQAEPYLTVAAAEFRRGPDSGDGEGEARASCGGSRGCRRRPARATPEDLRKEFDRREGWPVRTPSPAGRFGRPGAPGSGAGLPPRRNRAYRGPPGRCRLQNGCWVPPGPRWPTGERRREGARTGRRPGSVRTEAAARGRHRGPGRRSARSPRPRAPDPGPEGRSRCSGRGPPPSGWPR